MKKLLFATLIMGVALFVSCSNDDLEPVIRTLTVDVKAISISSGGETKTLAITSNTDWEITGIDAGITVMPTSGKGDKTVSITMPANVTFAEVVKNLTVKAKEGALTAPVTVTQAARDALTLATDVAAIAISSGGETKTLAITSNTDWEITGIDAGITVMPTSGKGDKTVSITMPANVTFAEVVKNLTVKAKEGALTAPVTVTQAARDALTLATDVAAIAISSGGETKTLAITSNTDWEITGIDAGITVMPTSGKGDKTVSITMPANATFAEVVKTLVVKTKVGTLSETITVTQAAKPTLTVTPKTLDFIYTGETKEITITSNTDWEITGTDAGITVTPLEGGAGTTTVTVTMPENMTFVDVVKTLIVKGKVGTLSASVKATQATRPTPELAVTATNFAFADVAGSKNLTVTSNTDWTITGMETGISVSQAKGKGNATVSITTLENTAFADIQHILTIKVDVGTNTENIQVTRAKTRGVIHVATAGALTGMLLITPTIKTASRMQITGMMNEADFDALRGGVKTTLKYLDISGLNITALPKNAVAEVTNLETVILPTKLTSIGERAFSNCLNLTTCAIPAGVAKIGQGAFAVCENLEEVICLAKTPPILAQGVFANANAARVLKVPAASVAAYKTDTSWTDANEGFAVDKIVALP